MTALWEDVNQKPDHHVCKNEWWFGNGVNVIRNKLAYGDYILAPPIVVDTKRDLYELAYNLHNDHERFREAAIKARDNESQLVILTENDEGVACLSDLADWIETKAHYAKRKAQSGGKVKRRYVGTQMYKTCKTMTRKYGLRFEFCTPQDAGERVLSILKEGEHGRNENA